MSIIHLKNQKDTNLPNGIAAQGISWNLIYMGHQSLGGEAPATVSGVSGESGPHLPTKCSGMRRPETTWEGTLNFPCSERTVSLVGYMSGLRGVLEPNMEMSVEITCHVRFRGRAQENLREHRHARRAAHSITRPGRGSQGNLTGT